jgi:putative ABC transport system permease protein
VTAGRVSFNELAAEAAVNLSAHPQRTGLALLGVVIGTACVIAIVSIGHMAQREAMKIFAATGVNTLVVKSTSTDPTTGAPMALPMQDLNTLLRGRQDIEAVTGLVTGGGPISTQGRPVRGDIAAVDPELQPIAGLLIAQGRALETVDKTSEVALVGPGLADQLAAQGSPPMVGGPLRIGTYVFTIVGVLAPRPAPAFDPSNFDNGVIVPLASTGRVLGAAQVNAAMLQLRPGADVEGVTAWLKRALAGEQGVQVQSARELITTMKAQKMLQARLLAAVGAVSLLVGGVGVMNVMVMSVMERRREIGLRMAVGARPDDIRGMFLVEAAALTAAGGLVGSLLGIGAAFITAQASHWSFSVAAYAIPLGVGIAVVVGVVFGLYPAIKASTLNPIEALRAD